MPQPFAVRIVACEDLGQVRDFYAACGLDINPGADERLIVAEHELHLIGVVRLCPERQHVILRTMRVSDEFQRRGVGTRLLAAAVQSLAQECYCLPWEHLATFYARGGFVTIAPQEAPSALRDRYDAYRRQGHRVIIMRRPAGGPGAA